MTDHLRRLTTILRVGFGAIFVLSGTDKFFNLMTYWPMYVSDKFAHMMPLSSESFMHVVGPLEIVIGVAMWTRLARLAGYAATAWMLAIAVNLITAGLYDLASRDVAIALGTFAVGQLSQIAHDVGVARPRHAGSYVLAGSRGAIFPS